MSGIILISSFYLVVKKNKQTKNFVMAASVYVNQTANTRIHEENYITARVNTRFDGVFLCA